MAGLQDIAPVTLPCHGVNVYGVSARGVADLITRFPALKAMLSGIQITPEQVMEIAPDAIAAIIAAGIGCPGNAEQEAIADRLPLEVQADLLETIFKVTMPGGLRPFMARFAALQAPEPAPAPVVEASTKEPASKSPSPSRKSLKRVTRPI